MVLAVSLTSLNSKLKSRDSLVLNLAIVVIGNKMIIETIGLEWSPLLREYASDYKKVEQIPVKGNALFSFALSQGATPLFTLQR